MFKYALFCGILLCSSVCFAVNQYQEWLEEFANCLPDDTVESHPETPRTPTRQISYPPTAFTTPQAPRKPVAKPSPAKTVGHSVEVSPFLESMSLLRSARELREFCVSGVFGQLSGELVSGIQSNITSIDQILTRIIQRDEEIGRAHV